ncbi:RHS repeat-associated core domain-containing protein [Streptomyces sp. NPDC001903]|uniref:RHS repeat-associated core domain-containing protein n=1 Tax=Streptomyces sp. NPDC001903 TaxID=3364622 RepID=UPI0036AD0511
MRGRHLDGVQAVHHSVWCRTQSGTRELAVRQAVLGKPEDTDTSLTHIGAREYDSNLGQFISVDPLLSLDQAQSPNGYAYANNNPITFSDPTGLRPDGLCGGSTSRCVPSDSKSGETVDYHEGVVAVHRSEWWELVVMDRRQA